MPPSDFLRSAVEELTRRSGYTFAITAGYVEGTSLYVVYTTGHDFPERYTASSGVLGFRVPFNLPDAGPEDTFFIQPASIKLRQPDPVRNSIDLNRASSNNDFLKGTTLAAEPCLVFSWHIWDRCPWDRRKHTLFDHYTHAVRRLEHIEHD